MQLRAVAHGVTVDGMRTILVLVLMAGCGTEEVAPGDAVAAATVESDCGPAPEQPEISLVISATDEMNRPVVVVQRADFERVVDFEADMRVWTRCAIDLH